MQPARWAPLGFAPLGLVAAWAVFILNTALLPFCEVAAAVPGAHAGTTHVEPPHDSPDSPCGPSLSGGSTVVDAYGAPSPDRSPLGWSAVEAPVAASIAAVTYSANLALARDAPSLSLRLYQRTQRLLL